MMRAARFSSQLGPSRGHPETVEAMIALAPRIEIVSAERINAELSKLLVTDSPRAGIQLVADTGPRAQLCSTWRSLR